MNGEWRGGECPPPSQANAGRIFLISRAGQRIVARLRRRLFAKLTRLELGFYDSAKTGELVNRLSSDTEVVGNALANNVSDGLRALAQGVIVPSRLAARAPGGLPTPHRRCHRALG